MLLLINQYCVIKYLW